MKKTILTLGLAWMTTTVASVAMADPEPIDIPPVYTITRVLGITVPLTGRDLNGTTLNGDSLEGHHVTNVWLEGALLGGHQVTLWLDGSEMRGVKGPGPAELGKDMVGVVMLATLENGVPVSLRVEGRQQGQDKWDRDVFRYQVSYQTTGGWKPLCGVDANGDAVMAIPLDGSWNEGIGATGGAHTDDPSSLTFACDGHALAKCVDMGYKPWEQALACAKGQGCHKTTLAAAHQACTRMLRADYCGDGTSYTVDGTEVNAYDTFGVRIDSLAWSPEAEWGSDGALCVVQDRIKSGATPPCMSKLARAGCAQPGTLGADTLIVSEIEPGGM